MYMVSPSEASAMTCCPGVKSRDTNRSTIMAICSSSSRLRKSFFWIDLTIRLVSLWVGGRGGSNDEYA